MNSWSGRGLDNGFAIVGTLASVGGTATEPPRERRVAPSDCFSLPTAGAFESAILSGYSTWKITKPNQKNIFLIGLYPSAISCGEKWSSDVEIRHQWIDWASKRSAHGHEQAWGDGTICAAKSIQGTVAPAAFYQSWSSPILTGPRICYKRLAVHVSSQRTSGLCVPLSTAGSSRMVGGINLESAWAFFELMSF